jgi:hypothetical protein
MDYEFELAWTSTVQNLTKQFGEDMDLQAILFLIGVQELGQGYQKFKKDQKVELLHVAICTLLEPYGYYKFLGRDDDSWPHFEHVESLPALAPHDQELLIRKAIVAYFKEGSPVR